ncbi:hypothetical protein [Streptomyces sp. NPDC058653]|uniref:hypothetical protein n=1 Tax=Streptomyces sp. NPDC058653 TaxID=3346576 RepID=UPI00364CC3D0
MKFRRCLAFSAVAVTIAPAVLLAAPVAYATQDSAAVSAAGPGSPSLSRGGVSCGDDGTHPFDDNLRTTFSGLPTKIVAGGGFQAFRLNVANTGDRVHQRVGLDVFASQVDDENIFTDFTHVTLQFRDPATGRWTGVPLDESDENRGRLGRTRVGPGASLSFELRVAMDAEAPAGDASVLGTGVYADGGGDCVYAREAYQAFKVLKADSGPLEPGTGTGRAREGDC